MKKILALLGTCSLLTAGVTTVVSCASKPNVDPSDDDNDIRKDLDLLLKIMNEAHEVFLNYALENNFKTVFDEVNRLIANKYSNYYVNSMPFAFKTSPSNLKVNYVDVAALQKLTTEPIKDLKAVVVNYSFGYTGSFKTLTNPARFNIKYVTTNNPNLIKTLMLDLTNKIGKVLIDFINQNPEITIDQNPAFKETYDMFNVYYAQDAVLINKDMLGFLDVMFKKNDVTKEIMEVVNYDSKQDILDLQRGTINGDNSINMNVPDWRTKYQTPAAWAGQVSLSLSIPFLFPAIKMSWQGQPPIIISTSSFCKLLTSILVISPKLGVS